jgi:hypothetical protein
MLESLPSWPLLEVLQCMQRISSVAMQHWALLNIKTAGRHVTDRHRLLLPTLTWTMTATREPPSKVRALILMYPRLVNLAASTNQGLTLYEVTITFVLHTGALVQGSPMALLA